MVREANSLCRSKGDGLTKDSRINILWKSDLKFRSRTHCTRLSSASRIVFFLLSMSSVVSQSDCSLPAEHVQCGQPATLFPACGTCPMWSASRFVPCLLGITSVVSQPLCSLPAGHVQCAQPAALFPACWTCPMWSASRFVPCLLGITSVVSQRLCSLPAGNVQCGQPAALFPACWKCPVWSTGGTRSIALGMTRITVHLARPAWQEERSLRNSPDSRSTRKVKAIASSPATTPLNTSRM